MAKAKKSKKWQQKVSKRIVKRGTKGALRAHYGTKKGAKIPTSKLKSDAARLHSKAKKGKLSASDSKLSKRINLALRYRGA